MAPPKWSVAVMCYNESGSLEAMVRRTVAVLRARGEPFEVVIIEDGSTDGSREIAARLADENAEVRVYQHPTNQGIGAVLTDGYRQTCGDVAMILPADLQFAPEDLPKAMERLIESNADVVMIRRPDRRDPPMRRMVSAFDETLVGLLFGVWQRDLHWVKLYRRSVLDRATIVSTTPMVDTELLVQAHRMGARIVSIDLPHHPRTTGQSTGAKVSLLIRTFVELFRLRLRRMGRVERAPGGRPVQPQAKSHP